MKKVILILGNITFLDPQIDGEHKAIVHEVHGVIHFNEQGKDLASEIGEQLVNITEAYLVLPTYTGKVEWECDEPRLLVDQFTFAPAPDKTVDKDDILKVAADLNMAVPTDAHIKYVTDNYDSEAQNDPTGAPVLWIEHLLDTYQPEDEPNILNIGGVDHNLDTAAEHLRGDADDVQSMVTKIIQHAIDEDDWDLVDDVDTVRLQPNSVGLFTVSTFLRMIQV